MQTKEIKKIVENLIKDSLPMPPVLGKVVKVYEATGKATFMNCLYSADVQVLILDEEGNFKDSELIIPDVPILSIGIGNQRGIYFLPAINSIVKVSFLYGSPAYPVIDGILPYFSDIPAHGRDDLNVYVPNNKNEEIKNTYNHKSSQKVENIKGLWQGSYNKVELQAPSGFFLTGNLTLNGNLMVNGNITASGQMADLSGTRGSLSALRDTFNSHTHKDSRDGTTSPPNQTI